MSDDKQPIASTGGTLREWVRFYSGSQSSLTREAARIVERHLDASEGIKPADDVDGTDNSAVSTGQLDGHE